MISDSKLKMKKQLSLSEQEILDLATENNVTSEDIIDFKAEFKAYDKGNKGKIKVFYEIVCTPKNILK